MGRAESSELINFHYFNAAGVVVERLCFLREEETTKSEAVSSEENRRNHLRPEGETKYRYKETLLGEERTVQQRGCI